MSLNTIELNAIAVCENCYNQKKKRLLGIFLFRRFQFNKNIVLESKNLYEFWLNFGLKNTDKINFTEEEKLNFLQTCYNILYSDDFNLIEDYEKEKLEFINQVKRLRKEEPHVHYNWIFPSPENYLEKNNLKIGQYE
jgi:hypothetical protein